MLENIRLLTEEEIRDLKFLLKIAKNKRLFKYKLDRVAKAARRIMGISQKKMQELISEKALYPADKSFKGLLRREAIVRSKLRTIYEIAAAPKRGFDNPEHAREVILNILINELNTEVWELREEKRREAARERAIGMQIFFGKLKLGMKRIRR